MSFSIAGTGSALPQETVSNERLGEFLQTSDEWIRTRTGIKNRHVLTSESLKDLAMEAAQNALRMSGTVALDLDLIICSTVSPDHVIPTLACEVQLALGANCPAFDLNAACSGFIYLTPFVEMIPYCAGKVERLMQREYPHLYSAALRQWQQTYSNWIVFHNRFTKENITTLLSPREYEIAVLVARGLPRREIAGLFGLSSGRLNNILTEIYAKLYIRGRAALRELIIF